MDLRLPLIVVQRGRRFVEAFVPTLPGVHGTGTSLSELRDDLALAVMERFEREPVASLGDYQLPPHVALRHVQIDTVAHDPTRRIKRALVGRIAVLVEKWPEDDFCIVTPTRLPAARFALGNPEQIEKALATRLAAFSLETGLESLDDCVATHRERLDILEVDADAPSILPRGPARIRRRVAKKPATRAKTEAPPETLVQREERRRRRRPFVRALRDVGRNLANAARDGTLGRAYGREALVRELVDAFDGREGAALVLIGPTGTGKTAVVHEVLRRWVARQDPSARRDAWRVDGGRFIAGMSFVGQWEARARMLVDEAADLGDILYVDDLASLVFAGRTAKGDTNVARFIEPHLARGELTVLAESTPERFARLREEAPTFASLFRVVHLEPLTDTATLPVLLGVLRELEAEHEDRALQVTPDALEAVLDTTRRFAAHEALPGRAVRLLREATGAATSLGSALVDRARVLDTVQQQTGLASFVLGSAPPETREAVRARLGAMVAGQPEAIEAVVDAVIALEHGLSDPGKPIATYLFVGPTGVGKTETAKALARYLFGSERRMARFDMSEFGSSASIARLVGWAGAPEGELTTALRAQPFCVVLFDEIEKAHPRVFDALLQLLGEGRITDASGRTADARQAVVIMTSNLGVREAAQGMGFVRGDAAEARRHYTGAVEKFFRPEFFNRLDRVVAFRALDTAALRVVVEHALGELLSRRGIRRGNLVVDVEPALLDLLVEQAYDPRYGARPLRRALERRLAVPLAHHLVRRRAEDLALVELFRRGNDMGLAVRVLRDAAAVADPARDQVFSTSDVIEAFAGVRARLETLEGSTGVARLEESRARALRRDVAPGDAAGLALLEALAAVHERVRTLEEGALSDAAYAEEEIASTRADYRQHTHLARDHVAGRKGLSARPGFIDVPLAAGGDAQVRRALPEVLALRDELDVLDHLVHAAAEGDEVALTVLIEGVTADTAPASLLRVLDAVPRHLAHARTWAEVAGADGARRWIVFQPEVSPRRLCIAMRGAGLRALLEAVMGFALLDSEDDAGTRRDLVALELLDGDTGPDAVAVRDEAVSDAHRARRDGPDEPAREPGVLVIRQESAAAMCRHVATGLAAGATDAVAAAMLRARANTG